MNSFVGSCMTAARICPSKICQWKFQRDRNTMHCGRCEPAWWFAANAISSRSMIPLFKCIPCHWTNQILVVSSECKRWKHIGQNMSVAPGFENLQRQDVLSVDFMKRFLPVSFYVLRQLLSNVEPTQVHSITNMILWHSLHCKVARF